MKTFPLKGALKCSPAMIDFLGFAPEKLTPFYRTSPRISPWNSTVQALKRRGLVRFGRSGKALGWRITADGRREWKANERKATCQ